ncbi:MAG: flagellar basal body P-ring formation protein FlgA [Gammaproteobacteria bacterium]|nr:flagellar basal body P-ring formation protein FlgA [Gammaproteobacteria bacterium]
MRSLLLIAGLLATLPAAGADAPGQVEDLERIRSTVQEFLTHQLGANRSTVVEVSRLDPRLRLARCEVPLTAYSSAGSRTVGHTSIGVRCDGASPWAVFVPARMSDRQMVVVAARPIAPGQLLQAADVRLESRTLDNASAVFLTSLDAAIGKTAMRAATAGNLVTQTMLRAPRSVRRGDQVTIAMGAGAISVQMGGVAMRDGGIGDRIPVKNSNSSRIVEGVIQDGGIVEVQAAQTF